MRGERPPNIVLLLTDQERSHKHWPIGWAESNLKAHYNCLIGCCRQCHSEDHRPRRRQRTRSSAVFANAFTATTECSPSRASILTSSFPSEHGVVTTPGVLDPTTDRGTGNNNTNKHNNNADGEDSAQLHPRPNLLRLLSKEKDYDVAWKGKWHLTPPFPTNKASPNHHPSILKWYGATSPWNPPDAGHSLSVSSTLGGGWKYNHDGRFLRGEHDKFNVLEKQQRDERISEETILRPRVGMENSTDDNNSDDAKAKGERTESVFDFLKRHSITNESDGLCESYGHSQNEDTANSKPFFLIVSLVNPHDVWASSCFANLTDEEFFKQTGYDPKDFNSLPMELPPNHCDDLSTKPSIQSIMKRHPVFGDLSDRCYNQNEHEQRNNACDENEQCQQSQSRDRCSNAHRYFRFYAYLHKIVDAEIASLLEALDSTGQMDNTIILRTSDHGELALSHGMREKRMQCYEETISVPFVINYPAGWFDAGFEVKGEHENIDIANEQDPTSSTCVFRDLVSSIDILPTIADLAGIDCSSYSYRGKSLVGKIQDQRRCSHSNHIDANGSRDDEILFTFDEPLAPSNIPGFIRCIRDTRIKYSVYFTDDGDIMEYEMYDLEADPNEMCNLCGPHTEPKRLPLWSEYHKRLTDLMIKMKAMPTNFDWVKKSRPKRWASREEAICALSLKQDNEE